MRLHSFESGRSTDVDILSRMVVRASISSRMLSADKPAQSACHQISVFSNEPQQQMLALDGPAAELTRLIACEEEDPACAFRVSLKPAFSHRPENSLRLETQRLSLP
jgi:hypothetical protein